MKRGCGTSFPAAWGQWVEWGWFCPTWPVSVGLGAQQWLSSSDPCRGDVTPLTQLAQAPAPSCSPQAVSGLGLLLAGA